MSREANFDSIDYCVMEISKLGDTGLRIKTKNTAIAVDPGTKVDAEIVIIIDRASSANIVIGDDTKLVVDGPGEHEVSGILITGEKVGKDVMYRLDDESIGLILASSTIAAVAKEEEGEQALLVKAIEPMQADTLNSYVQDVCIVFGSSDNVPNGDSIKRVPKVNLRKLEDLKGSLVVLAKE